MKILIATDGSANAIACIETLKARSYPDDTTVRLISVYDPNEYYLMGHKVSREQAQTSINTGLEKLAGCTYIKESEVIEGHPAERILEAAEHWQPDILFIGAHSQARWSDHFLGSITQTILENCLCSVAIIRTDATGNYRQEQKYLICVDDTISDTDSWVFKASRNWSNQGDFLVLNIIEPFIEHGSENPKRDAQIFLEELAKKRTEMINSVDHQIAYLKQRFPVNTIEGKVVGAMDIVETILQTAQIWQANLIIMYPHKRKGLDKFLIGSVSQEVTKRARCSVEIVR